MSMKRRHEPSRIEASVIISIRIACTAYIKRVRGFTTWMLKNEDVHARYSSRVKLQAHSIEISIMLIDAASSMSTNTNRKRTSQKTPSTSKHSFFFLLLLLETVI